jgi:hypothetical protein
MVCIVGSSRYLFIMIGYDLYSWQLLLNVVVVGQEFF